MLVSLCVLPSYRIRTGIESNMPGHETTRSRETTVQVELLLDEVTSVGRERTLILSVVCSSWFDLGSSTPTAHSSSNRATSR